MYRGDSAYYTLYCALSYCVMETGASFIHFYTSLLQFVFTHYFLTVVTHSSNNENLMWKTNYAKLFLDQNPDLQLIKEEHLPYLNEPSNVDSMYLLKKRY